MATGSQFLAALNTAISPATIKSKVGKADGIVFTLSTGKIVTVKRAAIKATAVGAALTAYVASVLA